MGAYGCYVFLLCQLQLRYEPAWISELWGEKARNIVTEKLNLKQAESHRLTGAAAGAEWGRAGGPGRPALGAEEIRPCGCPGWARVEVSGSPACLEKGCRPALAWALLAPIFGSVGSLCCHGDVEELMGWNSSQGRWWDGSSSSTREDAQNQRVSTSALQGHGQTQVVGISDSAAQRTGRRFTAEGLSSRIWSPPALPPPAGTKTRMGRCQGDARQAG